MHPWWKSLHSNGRKLFFFFIAATERLNNPEWCHLRNPGYPWWNTHPHTHQESAVLTSVPWWADKRQTLITAPIAAGAQPKLIVICHNCQMPAWKPCPRSYCERPWQRQRGSSERALTKNDSQLNDLYSDDSLSTSPNLAAPLFWPRLHVMFYSAHTRL